MIRKAYKFLGKLKHNLKTKLAPDEIDGRISIGEYTYGVSNQTVFMVRPNDCVTIGKYCSFGPGVRIFPSGEHNFRLPSTFPFYARMMNKGVHRDTYSKGEVIIGNDVWVGANVLILSGVRVGDGAVLAAGSVIVKDVEPYAIVSGVPATTLQYRFKPETIEAMLQIKWWDWGEAVIMERVEDLYLDTSEFVRKYGK